MWMGLVVKLDSQIMSVVSCFFTANAGYSGGVNQHLTSSHDAKVPFGMEVP